MTFKFSVLLERQFQKETGPFILALTFSPNPAVVRFGNLFGDKQTQAGAVGVKAGGVGSPTEFFKQFRNFRWINSNPAVFDAN